MMPSGEQRFGDVSPDELRPAENENI